MLDLKNEKVEEGKDAGPTKATPKRSWLNLLLGTKKTSTSAPEPKKIDINNYQDTEGLTVRKMEFGLWLVEHRKQLILIPTVFLITVSAVAWAYTLFGLVYYVIWGMNADSRLANELTNTSVYFPARNLVDLVVEPVQIIRNGNDKYDLVVKIKNENKRHWARLEYYFSSSDYEFGQSTDFILPNEEKYLLLLNQEFGKYPSDIQVFFTSPAWRLLNLHKFPDWENFKKEHLDFIVKDAKFVPAQSTILSERLNLNDLQFKIKNNTAYNYYEVDLNILLSVQSKIVSVNQYKIIDFYAGEERNINVTWYGQISQVDDIMITPEINITRDDIYVKFKSGDVDNLNY